MTGSIAIKLMQQRKKTSFEKKETVSGEKKERTSRSCNCQPQGIHVS